MHIDIAGLSEAEVESVAAQFEQQGLEFDVDYTTLHGKEWEPVGVRLLSVRGITAGAGLVSLLEVVA